MSFNCNSMGKLAVLSLGCLALGAGLLKADVTYGNYDTGNCYPFMCNDSGSNVGQSIDYQQVYAAGSFGVLTNITAASWYFASEFGGSNNILGGNYSVYWGYAAFGSVGNLSNNLASNYIGGPNFLGTASVPAGGVDYGAVLTLSGIDFSYDPTLGNLLLEFIVDTQDNVPNGNGNGFNEADDTGAVTSRAWCVSGSGAASGCFADDVGLVTTFTSVASTPEPGTLGLLGGALLGIGLLRKRLSKKA